MKRKRKSKRDEIVSYQVGMMDIFWLDDAKVVSSDDKIAWKGGYFYLTDDKTGEKITYPVLIKLSIPKDAYRTHYLDKDFEQYAKHRCSYAKVLGFYSYYTGKELKKPLSSYTNGISDIDAAYSFYTDEPIYEKGKIVTPNSYDLAPFVCGNGIHYFYEKESALIYLDWHFSKQYNLRKNCYHIWRNK